MTKRILSVSILVMMTFVMTSCRRIFGGVILEQLFDVNFNFINICNNIELDIALDCKVENEYSYENSEGCGVDFYSFKFEDDGSQQVLKKINDNNHWYPTPLDVSIQTYINSKITETDMKLPDFDNGMVFCSLFDDYDIFYSLNECPNPEYVYIGYWNSDNNMLYYYEYDL